MTTGYETEMPQDMPDEAYAGLSVARLHEWLARKALEQAQPVEPDEDSGSNGHSDDPTRPAA